MFLGIAIVIAWFLTSGTLKLAYSLDQQLSSVSLITGIQTGGIVGVFVGLLMICASLVIAFLNWVSNTEKKQIKILKYATCGFIGGFMWFMYMVIASHLELWMIVVIYLILLIYCTKSIVRTMVYLIPFTRKDFKLVYYKAFEERKFEYGYTTDKCGTTHIVGGDHR